MSKIKKEDVEVVVEDKVLEAKPKWGDPAWSDYVLSLMTEDELVGGKPKCDGLRRIINVLFDVVSSERDFVENTTDASGKNFVTVGWKLKMVSPVSRFIDPADPMVPLKTFSALASSSYENTKYPFSLYLASVSDTRAEARCYRKALLLKCLAAEETDDVEIQQSVGESISTNQKLGIQTMANRLGVDLGKTIAFYQDKIKSKGDSIDGLSREQGGLLLNILNNFQSNSGSEIPNEVKKV